MVAPTWLSLVVPLGLRVFPEHWGQWGESMILGEREQVSYTCHPVVSEESETHNLSVFEGFCIFAQKKILDTTEPRRKIT